MIGAIIEDNQAAQCYVWWTTERETFHMSLIEYDWIILNRQHGTRVRVFTVLSYHGLWDFMGRVECWTSFCCLSMNFPGFRWERLPRRWLGHTCLAKSGHCQEATALSPLASQFDFARVREQQEIAEKSGIAESVFFLAKIVHRQKSWWVPY